MLDRGRHYLEYFAARAFLAVLQALSLPACARLAELVGRLAFDVLRIRRGVIDENLRHAFPQLSQTARHEVGRQMWAHLVLMVAEIAHAPRKLHLTNWRQWSTLPQKEAMVRQLMAGRPLVVISGHFGNFELGGYMLGLLGFPTQAVARRLDNPLLDTLVNRFRGRTGQTLLPKHGSGDAIAANLRRGGFLAILGDQAAGRKGCWVSFFGRPASTHKAVAVLSLGANAPLMVTSARRLGQPLRYELALEDVADPLQPGFELGTVPLLAQWYTDRLERIIRRAPEQYWWVHRRWKGNPPKSWKATGPVKADAA